MWARVRAAVATLRELAPARAWQQFSYRRGPLLAQGLAYRSLFAVFAALWLLFAGVAAWLSSADELVDAIVQTVNTTVPGLIDTGDGGAIELSQLLSISSVGWTGLIAGVVLLWTATGWLGALRNAVRAVAGRPESPANPILLRALDLGIGLGLGIAFILSAALTVLSTTFVGTILRDWWQVDSAWVVVVTQATGYLVAGLIDGLALWGIYRGLALLRTSRRRMLTAVVLGTVGLEVLKVGSALILGGTTSNPLLASFATMIGLLLYFNMASLLMLAPAAWIGLDREDDQPDPPSPHDGQPRGLPGEV